MDTPAGSAPVETLLENHRAFLRYLERRVGDRALAEDILQDAFAKVVARPEQAPADEASSRGSTARCGTRRSISFGVVELLIARTRRSRVSLKRTKHPRTDMEAEICACVSRLAATLKPEYAEALEAIEVTGTPVKTFAEQKGLSSSNARCPSVPRTRSTQEARDRIVRHMCRARVSQLHVQARLTRRPRLESIVQPSFSSLSARMLTRSGQQRRDLRT